jgi:AraC-like DNA-binding protein
MFPAAPVTTVATDWRRQKAAAMLSGGRPAIAEVAGECIPGVGYESEAASAKAFKRSLGVSPGALVASVRSDVQTE